MLQVTGKLIFNISLGQLFCLFLITCKLVLMVLSITVPLSVSLIFQAQSFTLRQWSVEVAAALSGAACWQCVVVTPVRWWETRVLPLLIYIVTECCKTSAGLPNCCSISAFTKHFFSSFKRPAEIEAELGSSGNGPLFKGAWLHHEDKQMSVKGILIWIEIKSTNTPSHKQLSALLSIPSSLFHFVAALLSFPGCKHSDLNHKSEM